MMPTKILTAFALITIAGPTLAQDDADRSLHDIPHITVVGTAQTEVAPDLATITLGVTTEQSTATAAARATAAKARAVIAAAKTEGIAASDIATQSVTINQTFDDLRGPQGQVIGRKVRGFLANNVVSIKLRDLTKVSTLAQSLIDKGANRFDGISFSVEHPSPVLDKLTGEAVRNARTQAESAAAAVGVHLGRILRIERYSPQMPGTPIFRFAGGATFATIAPDSAASNMPVEAGTTTLNSEIAVTWALDPR